MVYKSPLKGAGLEISGIKYFQNKNDSNSSSTNAYYQTIHADTVINPQVGLNNQVSNQSFEKSLDRNLSINIPDKTANKTTRNLWSKFWKMILGIVLPVMSAYIIYKLGFN